MFCLFERLRGVEQAVNTTDILPPYEDGMANKLAVAYIHHQTSEQHQRSFPPTPENHFCLSDC